MNCRDKPKAGEDVMKRKKIFDLKGRQSNLRTEILAGITTFLTMAYIIFANPHILGDAGMNKEALIAVTCIVTALASIATGIFANAPIAMAPGMGLNAYFAYSLVMGREVTWEAALGIVFLSGLLFLVLTILGIRKRLVAAIPRSMTYAISVGIGLFITFIGLRNLGLVVDNEATLVSLGALTPTVLIGLGGLTVMIVLEVLHVRGSLLIGIVFSTILSIITGKVELPDKWLMLKIDISDTFFHLDILGALKWSFFGAIFSLMFMDMFDSLGTLVACCHKAEMVDEKGNIRGLSRLLGIDALATMLGALLGTSTTTSYIESGAGIEQGGRTGLTSLVTGLLFLLGLLFIPLIGIVPAYATAPALIMVGLFMMKEVARINFQEMDEGFPAFIIIVMITLSYSISKGLAFGFISFAMIKVVQGKFTEIKPIMWIITALSVLFLIL